MNKNNLLELADRYIKGECTLEEEILINKFLDSFHDENYVWYEKGLGIKEEVGKRILAKINRAIDAKKVKDTPFIFRRSYLLKVAASILIVLSLTLGAFYIVGAFSRNDNKAVSMSEKSTEAGQKLVITLVDGTTITLNSESQLKIPKNYNGKEREVFLRGEAYFDVAHNPDKAFIVNAGSFTIKDLGTVFDVKTFPDETDFTVSLVSGKVSVSKNNSDADKRRIVLSPEEQYSYDRISGTEKVEKFDYAQAVGWKDNILKFDDEPLTEVFLRLHRAYGIELDLKDKEFCNYSVTANFNNASLFTILSSLKKLTSLSYKAETQNSVLTKVTFYK